MSLILKSVIRHPQNSRKLIRVISATLGSRTYCQAKNAEPANDEAKLSGFAKAFDKHTEWEKPQEVQNENYTFASLLRNSKFIDVIRVFFLCHLSSFSDTLNLLSFRWGILTVR